MPRSALVALLFLVLAAGAAVVLWPDEPAGLTEPEGTTPAAEEDAPELAEVGELPADTTPPETPAERTEVETVKPPKTSDLNTEYAGANGTLVRVLHAEDGEPAGGADVFMLLREDVNQRQLEMELTGQGRNFQSILMEYGRRYRTNSQGEVMVPPLTEFPMLMAKLDKATAFEWRVDQGAKEVELLLEPAPMVVVTVRTADGALAPEAPVALQMQWNERAFNVFTRRTGEDGTLLLDDLQPFLESIEEGQGQQVAVALGVVQDPNLPDEQKQAITLTDEVLAEGAVELILPPTGRIEVRVVDAEGEPVLETGIVALSTTDQESRGFGPMQQGESVALENGVAVFPHVGLGLELEARFAALGSQSSDLFEGAGPTQPGEVLEWTIQRDPRAFVRARLLDEEGTPHAEESFQARLETKRGNGSGSRGFQVETDADGWFEMEVERENQADASWTRTLKLSRLREGVTVAVEMPIPFEPPVGVTELGEFRMIPPPILLRGRVLDGKGDPIARASLMFEYERFGSNGHSYGWRTLYDTRVATDGEGQFVMQGTLDQEQAPFRLQVNAAGFQTQHMDIQPVGQEVELRLAAGSYVTGEILLDEGFDSGDLRVVLLDDDGSRTWSSVRMTPSEEGPLCKFEQQVDVGKPYSLEVGTASGELLFSLPEVRALEGETVEPPGLQPLDLRGRLRKIQLEAFDTAGNKLNKAGFRVQDTNGGSTSFDSSGGEISLVVAEAIPRVIVHEASHLPVVLESVRNDQRVVMEGAIQVRVQVPYEFRSVEGLTVSVQVYPNNFDHNLGVPFPGRESLDEAGEAVLHTYERGTHRVSLVLSYHEGNSHRSRSLRAEPIEVTASGATHVLSVDRDRFADAVERLKDSGR